MYLSAGGWQHQLHSSTAISTNIFARDSSHPRGRHTHFVFIGRTTNCNNIKFDLNLFIHFIHSRPFPSIFFLMSLGRGVPTLVVGPNKEKSFFVSSLREQRARQ